jgi:hypothetical protein
LVNRDPNEVVPPTPRVRYEFGERADRYGPSEELNSAKKATKKP